MGEQDLKQEIQINADGIIINGSLTLPQKARGIVVFAHGSGSSRFSPRNKFVASKLNKTDIATLLIDLLTEEEERVDEETREYRFNIDLLASRLVYATHFVNQSVSPKGLKVGYFGASTGAAAALVAAAQLPEGTSAIVSRGGRPDLAGEALGRVKAPVLLLVGGEDYQVIDLNKQTLKKLTQVKNKELVIIPGATHLFEEPGKLEDVASYAASWFKKYL
ncbi:MAG: hypothetical protein UU73_C0003G0088 [Candidatus Daviesbacteria bacterium GW2011_GWA1_41_61]|uniref:Dienelactone hydrolase domain-containing protein n=1 Tax=Candidatus Daviesbacteria bacterium GW2011_GWA2_40_9 TaxID=1618424 RepID=A0A0G0WG05_9BACT|nr:MAG: Dienelactone hydrolase-like protein enzyme [Candidatus Daviesbacteria bacterium GW2011_GWC1_40_9]KKR83215.1 MAG: hypothetical protein UU29_C0007G0085 [Candidatus Daviesbacteria bacterium GW2011_GWA2_40_9]KKR93560.1 MAG: hypothetical protein UU44_C0002G0221 [Candidatus Daviesbacteria bacterium GW2011_GWB1_41_15]KKS14889.1 MAG: hypothetical protein UU73_C0003G0088 [Candidatus Daviesbacteria bacterium GW2011_GWA1_41_61]